jgi:hypothetical protein
VLKIPSLSASFQTSPLTEPRRTTKKFSAEYSAFPIDTNEINPVVAFAGTVAEMSESDSIANDAGVPLNVTDESSVNVLLQ